MSRIILANRHCLAAAALALPLCAAVPAEAVDFAPPAPGHRFEYECNSNVPNPLNPARTAEIKIEQVEGGIVTYQTLINGMPRLEIRQPLSLYGASTSLVEQSISNKGTRRVVAGLDKFPSLRDLKVGSTYEGTIEWAYESGKNRTFNVALTISEEAEYRTEAFGYIPVIVVEEIWTGPKTKITSKTYISPERSAVVAWTTEFGKWGIEACWLTGIRTP